MTAERKRAILFLTITLVIGILIGALLPGFYGRLHNSSSKGRRGGEREPHTKEKKEWFMHTMLKTLHPTSEQEKKIEPILKEASSKIEELEAHSNQQLGAIIDSVKIKLAPMLDDQQKKSLEEFVSKGEKKWHEKRGRR